MPKRRLLLLTQGLHMAAPLAMLALALAVGLTPLIVFALVFVRGCVNAVDYPTRQAFVMEIVGGEQVVAPSASTASSSTPPAWSARHWPAC